MGQHKRAYIFKSQLRSSTAFPTADKPTYLPAQTKDKMSTYVVNGASKGIGFEFLRQLSADPENTVIGIVRTPSSVQPKVASEIGRDNIHIIQGDLDDYDSLKAAAEATAKITGGAIDYLIANGGRLALTGAFVGLGELGQDHKVMEEEMAADFKTNTIGNINLFNVFMPLLLKGKEKKGLFISSGHGDLNLINDVHLDFAGPYAVGKAAMNVALAKMNAEYAKEGVMFMSISPGVVDTGNGFLDTDKCEFLMPFRCSSNTELTVPVQCQKRS
jgi:NAD(P)-dependent dehydrogenase (short-subunit alcohol dehydrogenase family)